MGDDEPLGNTSVFPPPPAVYRAFTEENVLWCKVLEEELRRTGQEEAYRTMPPDARRALQTQLLDDARTRDGSASAELALPDADLHELFPPNVAWIEQDGGFQLFGQRWPIPDVTPTLEALGLPRLFPDEPFARREALQMLLRTLLLTYFQLTSDLLRPIQPYVSTARRPPAAPPASEAPAEPPAEDPHTTRVRDHLQHLETAVINFQFLINQLRPVQARDALEQLLAQQVARRERQTQLLRAKSAAVRAALARLSL